MIFLYTILGLITLYYLERTLTHSQIVTIYQDKATTYGQAYDVPVPIILAVIAQESAGKISAVGATDDFGLMQITQPALTDFNRATGNTYTLNNMMYSQDKNIQVGTWYLHWTKNFLNGGWDKAIMAYNAGVGNYRAGQQYYDSVMEHHNIILNLLTEKG